MLLLIVDFLQNFSIIAIFLFIIALMIRQDLKDENGEEQVAELNLEVAKSITEVTHFENMSTNAKFKQIINELHKIDSQLLPCEKKMNSFYKCLTQVQKLEWKFEKMYKNEQIQYSNVIEWLEKPLVMRGKYKEIPYDGDGFESNDIKGIKNAIRSITTHLFKNVTDDMNKINNESDVKNVPEIPKSTKTDIFEIPTIKLENMVKARNMAFQQFWPLVKFWTRELFNSLLESSKIWYVVCMIIHRSILNSKNPDKTVNNISEIFQKLIIIQAEINQNDDVTTVTINIFPKQTKETENVFSQLIAKIKSVFEY